MAEKIQGERKGFFFNNIEKASGYTLFVFFFSIIKWTPLEWSWYEGSPDQEIEDNSKKKKRLKVIDDGLALFFPQTILIIWLAN